MYAETDRNAALAEIERLVDGYPSQRGQALWARTVLILREAAGIEDLGQLPALLSRLPHGDKGYLAEVPPLLKLVREVAEASDSVKAAPTPHLREARAVHLRQQIAELRDQVSGFSEPLATGLRAAAAAWLAVADGAIAHARAQGAGGGLTQVFRAGDPVKREQEAFVARDPIVAELAEAIELATGCPGIVLYGRRRVGKSTVLRNLGGFLPARIAPVYVSLQNAEAFSSLGGLVDTIVTDLERAADTTDGGPRAADLPGLARALAAADARLAQRGSKVLICLDEYENIDRKIGEGVFPPDLLAAFRESIQFHRNLVWLFAGSHDIRELRHGDWTSHLVSVRTVEVPLFTLDETRALLTRPLQHSTAWTGDDPRRPAFPEALWGPTGGIERIQACTGGWPHLVQLVAEQAITVMNRRTARELTDELFHEAIDRAARQGHNVFYELLNKECASAAEWDYLRGFAEHDHQPAPDGPVRSALRRRQLTVERNGAWHLRATIMGDWLRLNPDDPWHGTLAREGHEAPGS